MEYFIVGMLAAFGLLCALWALLGWALPGDGNSAAVCLCHAGLKEINAVRKLLWLRDWGFLKCPVLLVDCGLSEEEKRQLSKLSDYIEFCELEALAARLELERT